MRGSTRSNPRLLDEALKGGTVAVIPGFQGVSATTAAWRRSAAAGRTRRRSPSPPGVKADRCDIYTDVDGVYTTDPRIVPKARKLDAGHVRGDARAGRGRRQGAADPLGRACDAREFAAARAVGVRGQARHRHRRRAFRSGHGKKPDRRDRRRQERGAGHADRHRRPAGHGRGGHQPARRGRHLGRHDRPRRDPRHRLERPHLHRPARQPGAGDGGDRAAQGRDRLCRR